MTETQWDNPALSLFFGKETQVSESKNLLLNIMLSPGEFSVSDSRHEQFVKRVLSYGKARKIAIIGGTEAAENDRNNTHAVLVRLAPTYDYHPVANKHGEWLLVSRNFGTIADYGFISVIPPESGPAAAGGHNERGIVWVTVKPSDRRFGLISVGASHYVTKGEDPHTPRGAQNVRLKNAINDWGKKFGEGSNLVFHMADTNTHMPRHQPYPDSWLNCWQESGHYPGTEGNACIDTIARRKGDSRISLRHARALSDHLLPLPVDHSSVVASYDIKPLHNA